MRSIKELIIVEFKLFLREPVAVFFTLVFPLIPLLVFGAIFGKMQAMPGFRVIDVYVPALITMVMGFLGLMGIPIAISEYKEYGILKRYQASPLTLEKFLATHLTVQFTVFLVSSLEIVVVAALVFGIRFVFLRNIALVALALLIGVTFLFTVGFALAGVCSSSRAAQTVGGVVFFSMLFTSGAAIPRREFPLWLQKATNYVPLTHVVDSLTALWVGGPLREQFVSLGILIMLTMLAFLFAKLTFSWSD
jgi:ABC-2 type transport system permease protein